MHILAVTSGQGSSMCASRVPGQQVHKKIATKLLRIDNWYFSMINDESVVRQELPLDMNINLLKKKPLRELARKRGRQRWSANDTTTFKLSIFIERETIKIIKTP